MNRACLLLLVTLIQSQSDGILLPNPDDASESFEDGLPDFRLEDWTDGESPLPVDVIGDENQLSESSGKRSTSDAFTRRSALDKNFMRFGRASPHHFCERFRTSASDVKPSFFRFGRGLKENFIRFGRGGKDSFIRFGRARPDDFFRAGKSMRDNFIRFGKADRNFMRFGRAKSDNGEQELLPDYLESSIRSHGKFSRVPDDLLRFAKSGSQKDVRNGTNFLRFGKKEPEEVDLNNGSATGERKRRAAGKGRKEGEKRAEASGGQGNRSESPKVIRRSTGYFEELPGNFPRRLPPLFVTNSWQTLENLKNSRLTPFFPLTSDFPKSSFFSRVSGAKRNQGGGSNFIRFG